MNDTKKLYSLFGQFAYTQNYALAFTEMLDFFLLPFQWHDTAEGSQHVIHRLQSHPKKEILVELYTEIGALSEEFGDPIGALYEAEISKGKNGQFFTPDPICDFMAMMAGIESLQNDKTVYDPACGSGRMLLAAAKINRRLKFYGADIDEVCCKMTVVNMLLNSLTGEVCHIDTLRNTFFKGYKLLTVLKNGYYHPFYKEFTDPNESVIWLRPTDPKTAKSAFDVPFEPTKSPLMHQGVQGNLFHN
ncbi:N-6 DNA methylase [Mucilaginibacter sp.]|uniref:HsdM family class I SAM-dependent methyltransferase n=1 Tax=Mucilaginibacter sp. TaxID=1882438 RepID=UPI00260D07B4|nr:N-6 DNA methylase [Mucilaginibacter sp.]MDB4921228.1 Type restriction-modification system methyltransferase subunit [Mucilaginibacter sp.]